VVGWSLVRWAKMGLMLSQIASLFEGLWGTRECKILVLGLDNAGKTSILYRMQIGEVVSTIPTIGFNVETVEKHGLKFQVWDLGGQSSIRPYWRVYMQKTDGIVFVVDSCDTERLDTSRDELHNILAEDELAGASILVYANKQDLPLALTDSAIAERLALTSITNQPWAIFRSSAITGEGIFEGMEWLAQALKSADTSSTS